MNVFGVLPETWFPVVTLIVGVMLKGVFDKFADRRAASREREARREGRLDAIRLRRVEFQRATLLEFQETITRMVRSVFNVHHADTMAYKQKGKWKQHLLPDDIAEENRRELARFSELRVRVRDEKIRSLSKNLSDECLKTMYANDMSVANDAMSSVARSATALHERIGEILRALDEDEDRVLDTD